MNVDRALARRSEILGQIETLRPLRRATLNEQLLVSTDTSGQKKARGPYWVESRREGTKTVSRRLQPGPELDRIKTAVSNYHIYTGLLREFEQITEQLDEAQAHDEQKKKRFKPSKSRHSTQK